MANFLEWPIVNEVILPFLLIFTLIFALLEKTKLLGDDKHQINAIMGLVIGGLLVTFGNAVERITQLTVFLSVSLVIIFIFLLLFGFISGNKEGDMLKDYTWAKLLFLFVIIIAVTVATLIITDTWDKVYDFFASDERGQNIFIIILIGAAIYAVLKTGNSGRSS